MLTCRSVVELAGDVPDLWVPAGGEELMRLMAQRDTQPVRHRQVDDDIRHHIRRLRAEDVPPIDEVLGRPQVMPFWAVFPGRRGLRDPDCWR